MLAASPDKAGETTHKDVSAGKRICDRSHMRVTGVDACKRGWVAVTLQAPGPVLATVRMHASLAGVLDDIPGSDPATIVGIDMPLGLVEAGWRDADRLARGLLGPRRSSIFAIPPRPVWAQATYQAANQRCRELTGQGFSIQAWGLRPKLLEANEYVRSCGHRMYEVHPELAFGAIAGAPLPHSKHTAPGRDLRRELLAAAGIILPVTPPRTVSSAAASASAWPATLAPRAPRLPVTDTLDAAAVAWSAWRIAAGKAVVIPDQPQLDRHGHEITIRF
jgi:predicted RNase H-like nuclease